MVLGEVWDGWLFVEKLNWLMLLELGVLPADWRAGIEHAIEKGWLWKHESGTYVKITDRKLFADQSENN